MSVTFEQRNELWMKRRFDLFSHAGCDEVETLRSADIFQYRPEQALGIVFFPEELPIERILREVRVYRIFEGTDEIQKRSIARNLLRGHVRVGSWDRVGPTSTESREEHHD